MGRIIGGRVRDIPAGTPRKYPAAGPRPVRLSIQSYAGIVGGASHYVVNIEVEANPFWPCNCPDNFGTPGPHEHEPWDDKYDERRHWLRDLRCTSPHRAARAMRRAAAVLKAAGYAPEVEPLHESYVDIYRAMHAGRTGD